MTALLRRLVPLAAAAGALGFATAAWYAQAGAAPSGASSADALSIERGRYLAKIAGCNDCHTAGYAQSGGKVAEALWLTGDPLGWQGPWGTTYPANLRLALAKYSEEEWVRLAATTEFRPPMPWFALRDMTEADLRALYRFVRYLGPAGEPAPAYVPPGMAAPGPVIAFPSPPRH